MGDKLLGVSDGVSEKQSEMSSRVRSYIGGIDSVSERLIDNDKIVTGYRINHKSVGSVCRSLCRCHNETVNIWSHIGGVVVFIAIFTVLCVRVYPHQYFYAAELDNDYEDLYASGLSKLNQRDPKYFIDTKIEDLSKQLGSLLVLDVANSDDEAVFEESISDILHRVEGISYFTIKNFYSFEYLESYNELLDPTYTDLIKNWYDTFNQYNSLMRE